MMKLTHVNVWVHDQEEALAFYTQKLGMELREDVTLPEMGGFRWLTVGPPAQPDLALALMEIPGPPVFDAETAEQLKAVMAKGAVGGLFFSTDDCKGEYVGPQGTEASSSRRSRPSARTASMRGSATPPATSSAWCRRSNRGARLPARAGGDESLDGAQASGHDSAMAFVHDESHELLRMRVDLRRGIPPPAWPEGATCAGSTRPTPRACTRCSSTATATAVGASMPSSCGSRR